MSVKRIVDPPSGWRYGFPRPFDFTPSHPSLPGEDYEHEYRQWFIDHGYPASEVAAGMLDHCRWWSYNDNDDFQKEAVCESFATSKPTA